VGVIVSVANMTTVWHWFKERAASAWYDNDKTINDKGQLTM
jgi:hypothetical protein